MTGAGAMWLVLLVLFWAWALPALVASNNGFVARALVGLVGAVAAFVCGMVATAVVGVVAGDATAPVSWCAFLLYVASVVWAVHWKRRSGSAAAGCAGGVSRAACAAAGGGAAGVADEIARLRQMGARQRGEAGSPWDALDVNADVWSPSAFDDDDDDNDDDDGDDDDAGRPPKRPSSSRNGVYIPEPAYRADYGVVSFDYSNLRGEWGRRTVRVQGFYSHGFEGYDLDKAAQRKFSYAGVSPAEVMLHDTGEIKSVRAWVRGLG